MENLNRINKEEIEKFKNLISKIKIILKEEKYIDIRKELTFLQTDVINTLTGGWDD